MSQLCKYCGNDTSFNFLEKRGFHMDEVCFSNWRKEQSTPKEYRYWITWTKKPNATEDDVMSSINKFVARKQSLGLCSVDYVRELTKNGEVHFHMRVICDKSMKKNRISHYEKHGYIKYVTVKPPYNKNWEILEEYCEKEGDIITLL